MNMLQKLPILLSVFLLASCAGMNQALDDQNTAISGVRPPTRSSPVKVARDQTLTFRRGAVETVFEARLISGEYRPVAESSAGIFYIAPKGSFTYRHQGHVESVVGGVFVDSSTRLVLVVQVSRHAG
jgi:hypothetical protein